MRLCSTEDAWKASGLVIPSFAGKTMQWCPSDTEENFKLNSRKTLYSPHCFRYDFNQYGYRCDEFNDVESDIRILFVGCSFTMGIGLPVADVWPIHVINAIRNKFNVRAPYWNIALGGASMDLCTRNFVLAAPLLKPDIVVGLLPSPGRFEITVDGVLLDLHLNFETRLIKSDIFRISNDFFNDEHQYYLFKRNLTLMAGAARLVGCDFVWAVQDINAHRWAIPHLPAHITANFVPHIMKIPSSEPMARDGLHAGPAEHKRMADKMLAVLEPVVIAKLAEKKLNR
jgi:hypothetical protein